MIHLVYQNKCGGRQMAINTNELWVIHEFETCFIHLGARSRRGKLILIYDYGSQFILDAQICFVTEPVISNVNIMHYLWRYGIPDAIWLSNYQLQKENWNSITNGLGIKVVLDTEIKAQMKSIRLIHTWQKKLKLLSTKRFQDLQELKETLVNHINWWNYQSERKEINAPAAIFLGNVRNHIFIEKRVLGESYLIKFIGNVTEAGTVQVLHRLYQVPDDYLGKQIMFRMSALQKQEIYIYDENINQLIHRCPFVKMVEVT